MRDLPDIIFGNNWLEKRLARKDDSKSEVSLKKTFFLFLAPGIPTLFVIATILLLFNVRNYALAMFIFTSFEIMLLSIFLIVRKNTVLFAAINQYFLVLFSFGCVLAFGGILNSGGVVLVGLAGVLNSISFLSPAQTKRLLLVYLFTIFIEVIADSYIEPISEITPRVNLILFALHLLIIAFAVLTVLSFYFDQSSRIKKMEADHLKELDNLKTRFYTNVTHEFRTPLTIILGLSENILSESKAILVKNMQLIHQNGIRLLQLVNRMLDLSKLEAKAMKLNPIQTDLFSYIRSFIEPYKYLANEKSIQLSFQYQPDKLVMDFDPEKIETLIGNLLSNSIKFAKQNSKIEFLAELTTTGINATEHGFSPLPVKPILSSHTLRIKIKDEGEGINPDNLSLIFNRFYKENNKLITTSGSGIGLLLVKELVDLMNGNLFVTSKKNKGTEFTIFLPVTNMAEVVSTKISKLNIEKTTQPFEKPGKISNNKLPKILIIEDNNDLVYFLQTILKSDFSLEQANNGQQGIELAQDIIPDLVISDIMIPKKDGYEVCIALKNDFRTSHIPIILLTARADIKSKISGYKAGADAYLSKPFEKPELRSLIQNLIENRKKLKSKFRTLAIMSDKSEITPSNPDEKFLEKLRKIMYTNYSEDSFGTKQLTREIGMSRVQFFRKLKALTGLSPSHFMRLYRLTIAKEKIQNTKLRISEIAYDSGFKDPTYFTHAFVNEFGISPSKARINAQGNET